MKRVAAIYDIHWNLPELECVGASYGKPGAYWLLLGPDIQFRHTPFDLAKAAERIRETNYPQAQDFAQKVVQPPSESEMLEQFTQM